MTNTPPRDPDPAIALFTEGLEILQDRKYRYAAYGLFSEEEAQNLDNLSLQVKQYLQDSQPPRPLCLAVFGAPGSGKSRLVKALRGLLGDEATALAPLTEINLTQMTSVDNLASAL